LKMVSKDEVEKCFYSCSICNKVFTTISNRNRHMKSHNIDKEQNTNISDKFKCLICDKRMRDNYQLKLHIRTHTKEKPFQCNECQISFGRSGDLKRHKTKCDGKIKNHCTTCNQVFRNRQLHNDHVLWDAKCGKLNSMKPSGLIDY
jgi:KRAB domain-containing zinc finger protein